MLPWEAYAILKSKKKINISSQNSHLTFESEGQNALNQYSILCTMLFLVHNMLHSSLDSDESHHSIF